MFTIRSPLATYGGIKAGVSFTAGVGHTDNPGALAYFARAGYEILPAGTGDEIVPDAYEGLTKKQLVALAAERGIEVNPKSSNDVLRDALTAAALAEEAADTIQDPAEAAPSAEAPSGTDPFAPGADRPEAVQT